MIDRTYKKALTYDRNNVVAQSLGKLELSTEDSKALLRSPGTFLSKASEQDAAKIRSVLIPAYREGFRVIFLVGAGLAALAFVIAFVLMPQMDLARPDDVKLKEEAKREEEQKKLAKLEKSQGGRC